MNGINENKDTMSRREREKAAHRQEILDAATRVFARKGFHTATLDEVAEEAEFSKGALYLHFQSKEDLLYSIITESFNKWLEEYNTIMSEDLTYKEKLTAFLRAGAEATFNHPELTNLTSQQHAALFMALSEENQIETIKLHDEIWTTFNEITKQAIDDGELRNVCSEAIVGMIHGSIDSMMMNKWNCTTLKQLYTAIDCFMDIILNGIVNKEST